MSTVHVTETIHAPAAEVWSLVMDPWRLHEWVSIHRDLKSASEGPVQEGATMVQVLTLHGVHFTVKWELTHCEQNRSAEWTGKGPAGSKATTEYRLREIEPGVTQFDYINKFKTPGGILGKAAGRVLVEGSSEREAHRSLTRLRELLEK